MVDSFCIELCYTNSVFEAYYSSCGLSYKYCYRMRSKMVWWWSFDLRPVVRT